MAVHVLHLVDGLHHAAVVDVRDVRVDVQDVAVGETFLAVFDALLKGGVFKSATTDVEPKLICHLRPTVKAGASISTLVRATEDFCDPEVVPTLKAEASPVANVWASLPKEAISEVVPFPRRRGEPRRASDLSHSTSS